MHIIETPAALDALAEDLLRQERVAVDTEANSLHAYRERVCLIQLSTPTDDYIVDPLALETLEPLAAFFASPAVEKVFHAADYDLMVLQRDFGFSCGALFDTMWAARVLGWPKVGLGDLLEAHFGVHVDKRYQRHDWGRRPLDSAALWYARMDSHYLLALRQVQYEALKAAERWDEAREIFDYLATMVHPATGDDVDAFFWRIKGVHDLRPSAQRVLYQLHLWREREAERLDRPPVKVISSARLLRLAQVQPRTLQELIDAGLTARQASRFGRELLKAIHTTPLPPVPPPPENGHPPAEVVARYRDLKAWRKEVAAERGVDSDVILPNAVLWELAAHPPRCASDLLAVPGIGPWRQAAYGPAILEILAATT